MAKLRELAHALRPITQNFIKFGPMGIRLLFYGVGAQVRLRVIIIVFIDDASVFTFEPDHVFELVGADQLSVASVLVASKSSDLPLDLGSFRLWGFLVDCH